MLKHYRALVSSLILSLCLLSGCQQAPVQPSADDYLRMAAANQGALRHGYLIKAASVLVSRRQLVAARHLLDQLQKITLSPQNSQQFNVVLAKYQLFRHKNQSAITILSQMNHDILDPAVQRERLSILAQAYWQQNKWQQSIITLDQLIPLQSKKEGQDTVARIWNMLLTLPNQNIISARIDQPELLGWVTLAEQSHSAQNAYELQQRLLAWQSQYPNHPAQALLPAHLGRLTLQTPHFQKIALMLPLHGPYVASGDAIRNGVMAAYYADATNQPSLDVIDTSNGHIAELYRQAVNNGAQLVIGPLTKPNIESLIQRGLSVPTIALNTLSGLKHPPKNLFQFGLSPLTEAKQVAKKAWHDQHQNALILMPDTPRGKRIANAFKVSWQQLGGHVNVIATYHNMRSLKQDIKHALNIDASYGRKSQLRQMIGKRIRMIPQRRQDIDVIFLVSNSDYAHQIKPLLNFYFAGNIDTYALSSSFDTHNRSKSNLNDLNGVIFSDAPWIINPNQMSPQLINLQHSIARIWRYQNSMQSRLYALGIDAYTLSAHLNRLQYFPAFGLPAATGNLFITQNNGIDRRLNWAKIKTGIIHRIL